MILEVSPKLVKSVTQLIPDFSILQRMKLNKPLNKKIAPKLSHWSVNYLIASQFNFHTMKDK